MKILLIRHGLTDWVGKRLPGRRPGIHLNESGHSQAGALARRLAPLPLAAIYSSPLERAMETAQPLAAQHGLQTQVCEGVTEVDCGDWTSREMEDVRHESLWQAIQVYPSAARFPGGESLREARDRVVAALDAIRDAHQDQMVAVVSHADPIKLAVAHYAGLPFDLFQRLVVTPASVTALDLRDLGPRLLCFDWIEDLSALLLADRHPPIPGHSLVPGPSEGGDEAGKP